MRWMNFSSLNIIVWVIFNLVISIQEYLKYATQQFLNVGIDTASLDARILLESVTGFSPEKLLINLSLELSEQQIKHYKELIDQRLKFKPIAYIIGYKEFYGLNFIVNENVLIPRPDSECLVEAAIKYIKQYNFKNILELGVGSGCLLLSILFNSSPKIDATAIDISDDAIAVATQNYKRLKLGNAIEFLVQNWGTNLAKKYDCIISNPPYIDTDVISKLQPDVRDFEPRLALDGGGDGMNCYQDIASQLSKLLNPGGIALFEIGINQAESVTKIFHSYNFVVIEKISDLTGVIRCLAIKFASDIEIS